MRRSVLSAALAISALTFTPVFPVFDLTDGGAAFAKGEKGDKGGGKPQTEAKGGKGKKADGGAPKTKKVKEKTAKLKTTEAKIAKVKGKPVVEGEMHPSELGKMNGALNANINAVLAHIRNGQTDKGPVGLLAGLAIADAEAAAILEEATQLQDLADAFDTLDSELEFQDFATVEDYLEAKADGTATEEQMAALDPLIEATGGTTDDGLALAETAPTPDEILAAEEAAQIEADALVDGAEAAILDAWNKDGDEDALLAALRARLALDQDAIAAAIAETEVIPEEEIIVE